MHAYTYCIHVVDILCFFLYSLYAQKSKVVNGNSRRYKAMGDIRLHGYIFKRWSDTSSLFSPNAQKQKNICKNIQWIAAMRWHSSYKFNALRGRGAWAVACQRLALMNEHLYSYITPSGSPPIFVVMAVIFFFT